MTSYLLLLAPSANQVYAAAAPALMAAELQVVAGALLPGPATIQPVEVAGVPYLSLVLPEPLDPTGVAVLSRLSAAYALFEQDAPASGEDTRLIPVELGSPLAYSADLLTIQKYPGKTNEQFTRLLLNVTAAATARPERLLDGTLTVLDPMCGRGTTLNQALACGLDSTGIDLDQRDFEAYTTFLRTWLRTHRLKHTAETGSLRHEGRQRGRRLDVEVAPTKEDHRAGRVQRLTYLCTDTTDLDGLLRAGQFDVLVTDTPYGVQHGSRVDGDRLARSPLAVLDAALPGWVRVLRTGGAAGLAYNRKVIGREDLGAVLARHGLTVVDAPGDQGFRHRVDASIDRDVIVARKEPQPKGGNHD